MISSANRAGAVAVLWLGMACTRTVAMAEASGDAARGPALTTVAALLQAGGWPSAFRTTTLVRELGGDDGATAVATLVSECGAAQIKQSVAVMDFVVADALHLTKFAAMRVPLPESTDGPALTAALYAAGSTGRTRGFAFDTMLDRLLTQPVRVRIARDVDAKFGRSANATFQRAAARLLNAFESASAR